MRAPILRICAGLLLVCAVATANAERIDVAASGNVGVVVVAADSQCSLREAMLLGNGAAANSDCAATIDGNATFSIHLPDTATFSVTDGPYDADGPNGLPDVTGNYVIEGHGANITRSTDIGTPQFRLLHIAASGELTLRDVVISNGHAPDGLDGSAGFHGGGIYNQGELMLAGSAISNNRSGDGGNSLYSGGDGGAGGGIYNVGALTVAGSMITGNAAGDGGDAGDQIKGVGGYGGAGGGLYSNSNTAIAISDSVVSDNATGVVGDGVGAIGGFGGGIYFASGTATVTSTTVNGNEGEYGGGIYGAYLAMVISSSTVSDNTARSGNGGEVMLRVAELLAVNSTIVAAAAATGAAVRSDFSSATFSYVTIIGNTGGALYVYGSPTVPSTAILNHSIVAGAAGSSNCKDSDEGIYISHGFNIASDTSCGFAATGDMENTDPLLGPLAANGGPTPTMLPMLDSPAIDAVPASACATGMPNTVDIEHDQRGFARPTGGQCDIGAVELLAAASLRALGYFGMHPLAGDMFPRPLWVQAVDAQGDGIKGLNVTVDTPASGASATCLADGPTDSTGVARVFCVANPNPGTYTIHLSVNGIGMVPVGVDYLLTNLPNDRIFGTGFGGTTFPTAETLP